jgi:bifunctional DNase/RNase
MDSPIFVEDDVVNKAHGLKIDENLETSENLRRWLETLKPEDFGKYKM